MRRRVVGWVVALGLLVPGTTHAGEPERAQAERLLSRAGAKEKAGDYAGAVALAHQAVGLFQGTVDIEDKKTLAKSLSWESYFLLGALRPGDAARTLEREVRIRKELGEGSSVVGARVGMLAAAHYDAGDPTASITAARESLRLLAVGGNGAEHDRLWMQSLVGRALGQQGKFDEAIEKLKPVIDRWAVIGPHPRDPRVSISAHVDLGDLLCWSERCTEGMAVLRRAVALADEHSPADAASGLSRLGEWLAKQNLPGEAAQLARDLETRTERATHPAERALLMSTSASVQQSLGELESAVALFEKAAKIFTEAGWSAMAVTTHRTTAELLVKLERFDEAERTMRTAIELADRSGTNRMERAGMWLDLAVVLLNDPRDRSAEAAAIVDRVRDQANGRMDPALELGFRTTETMTAMLTGDEPRARAAIQRAVDLAARHVPDSAQEAVTLHTYAGLEWLSGNVGAAVEWKRRAVELQERELSRQLGGTSEVGMRRALDALQGNLHATVTLHLLSAPTSTEAAELAYATLVRWKGRIAHALTSAHGALRERLSESDAALLDELEGLRREQAHLSYRGDEGAKARLAELRAKELELEKALAEHGADAGVELPSVDDVRGQLPDDTALIEYVAYRASHPHDKVRPWRYAAYVLSPEGGLHAVDLGLAEPIDAAISRLRTTLAKRRSPDEDARWLHDHLVGPLLPWLDATHWLIAPDGQINLVPFAVLSGGGGRLLEAKLISYIDSGRDVMHLNEAVRWRSGPALLADPRYGDGPWTQLPGTRIEAGRIATLVREPTVHLDAAANETEIKRLGGPSVLHVATHGYFLDGEGRAGVDEDTQRGLELAIGRETMNPHGDPLLASGLVLARAGGEMGDDGFLTASEMSTLDLYGTQLAVLSACETAVGEVRNGDGVHGLRRALTVAGARTQVISLWKVNDEATTELMVSFYRHLVGGASRAQALRAAQTELASTRAWSHPYFWAGFILSGAWGPMPDGILVDTVPDTERPQGSSVGCQCAASPGGATWGPWWVMLAGVALRRWRRPLA